MDIKLVPYADKVAGSLTTTGQVSADDLNQIKKILNAITQALFDLDSSGVATTGVVKLVALPDVELLDYFNDATVVGGKLTIGTGSGSGSGTGSTPQLTTPASLTASNIAATSLTLTWPAVAGATSYTVVRSLTADFASNITIYNGSGVTLNDTGLTASTLYYYRIIANASGYTSSPARSTSATTIAAASGGGSGSGLTSLTAFDFVDTIQPVAAGSNSFKWSATGGGSSDIGFAVKSSLKIPAGGTGYVQVQCLPNTVGSSSGWIGLFKDVVNYTGISDSEMACRRNNAGSVGWRYTGISENGTANGALADDGYLRIRTDGTTIYLERSTDQTTWTLVVSRAQINQDLFIHLNIYGSSTYGSDQDKVSNIQYTGFVAA